MRWVIAEDLWCPLPEWVGEKYEVVQNAKLYRDPSQLVRVAATADALVVRNQTRVDRILLEQLPRLKAIGRLGVGLDNIDLAACRERGVAVVAAIGCNASAVAEYVLAALFQHARDLNRCDQLTRGGEWKRSLCFGTEICGKTLGLVGLGDIGLRVALRARMLGMHVIAYDPFVLPTHFLVQEQGVELLDLPTVCERADYLSLHLPLTTATRHLLGEKEFALMKDNAVLINTSRGGIIDESALYESLQKLPRRFAILDVREQEPPGKDDLLATLDNILLTPHIAGLTHESATRVAEMVMSDLDRVLNEKPALGQV